MEQLVTYSKRDEIGVIAINNPPVNALSSAVLEGIRASVDALERDHEVHAIVVIGRGRTFVAGADINQFVEFIAGRGEMLAFHPTFMAIENCSKPVVMAIHGTALGGGLELAMSGHYRAAAPDAQVGQPEVKIGLIPGAGGTQRLPRLAGVAKAAEMCAFGEPISAKDALAAGIIDRIVDGDLLEGAIAFARTVKAPRRTCDLPVKPADVSEVRKRLRGALIEPELALDSVEAAMTLPFPDGIRREAELFERCLHSDQSKALIHAFFAERAVAKIPDIPKDTALYTIRNAGVIGAGTMGGGIAMALANAGIPVRMKDTEQTARDRGMAAIRKNYERSVKSGRLTAKAAEERIARITPQVGWEGFDQADITIEAVFESLALKKQVFAELDKIAKAECVLATNTSTLDIDAIAAATSRPQMVIGMHFFSPANVMRLVEVVRGSATSKSVVATGMSVAKTLKKVGVVVRNGFGFVGNRMMFPYMEQAQLLVEEGATPEQVDRALTNFGMAMGPLAVADLSGIDVFWRIQQEFPEAAGRASGIDKLYAAGRYGQKSGAGFYRYDENRKAAPDAEVVALLQKQNRVISDQEIVERCIYALINEGARVLEEGIALRAVDIDVIYLTGYGFPAYRGGPMFYADTVGLKRICERVLEFGSKPAALLERLAAQGQKFA
ncbi:MAG TPA: 3-hydroxyacyl-CoA dehydrogenase NAD-binding domain-containing protein [Bryobacteraceae bacterium]|nr:3-hydroxyacyl-CoA dehydrogenase NAD-binding domain-containing protein [Bryobacteraceae bacterium]